VNAVKTIAGNEFRAAFRNRMFVTITVLFLGLSILSAYIGSTTKHAEMRIYNETVAKLTSQGVTQMPPVPEIHPLTMLGNLTEYVAIIGAILAVMLGYSALTQERENGSLQLILTRPVFRDQLITGKLLGNGLVIASLLGLVFAFNVAMLVVVGHAMPTLDEVVRIALFVVLAFAYMSAFLIASMLLSINMKSSASVFLVALVIWITSAFVLPQMADTLMANSTVVNTISGTTNQIPQDTPVSRTIDMLSPTWQLRTAGGKLLETVPGSAELTMTGLLVEFSKGLLALLVPCVVLGTLAYVTFLRNESLTLE
jgi:ABC-2 type transport system permease protein